MSPFAYTFVHTVFDRVVRARFCLNTRRTINRSLGQPVCLSFKSVCRSSIQLANRSFDDLEMNEQALHYPSNLASFRLALAATDRSPDNPLGLWRWDLCMGRKTPRVGVRLG